MKFNIKGVGLDISQLDYSPVFNSDCKFDYIHSNLSSNNESLVREYISNYNEEVPIIITTDFLDEVELALRGHLVEFNRESVDLLLINSKCDIDKYQETIVKLVDSECVKYLGVSLPESLEVLEKLEEIYTQLGISDKFKYVSLNISPYSINYDILKYCYSHNITVFGFNPLGGYITAPTLISSYTVPYLLEFSANYCDVVFLSSRDLYNSVINKNYLQNLINVEDVDTTKYELGTNVDKLLKPADKVIYTGFRFEDGSLLPFDNPGLVYYEPGIIETYQKKILPEILDNSEPAEGTFEKTVYDYYKTLHFPEDGTEADFFSIIRFQIFRLFDLTFKDYSKSMTNIGNRIVILHASKTTFIDGGWFKKDTISTQNKDYLLYFYKGTFLFKEVKRDPTAPEDLKIDDINFINK